MAWMATFRLSRRADGGCRPAPTYGRTGAIAARRLATPLSMAMRSSTVSRVDSNMEHFFFKFEMSASALALAACDLARLDDLMHGALWTSGTPGAKVIFEP